MDTRTKQRSFLGAKNRLSTVVLAVFVFGILLVLVNIYQLQQMRYDHDLYHGALAEGHVDVTEGQRKPVVWVVAPRVSQSCHQCVVILLRLVLV